MQQTLSTINKLQSFCNNQIDDPKLFGLVLYDFMQEYDKNVEFSHINSKILVEAKSDTKPLEDLKELAIYEMELAYYEYRDHQAKKYVKNHHSIFNNVFDFELYRDNKMALISESMIACYRILRDFVWLLVDDNSDEAKILLKKSVIFDEEGRIQECIFASSFYEYEKEKKRLEDIQKIRVWYSWNKLVYFYLNYDQAQYELKKEDIPELRIHMTRILQYSAISCENMQSTNEEKEEYNISYDHKKNILTVNSTSTDFKKNSDSWIVIKMLFSSQGFIKKKVLKFETIYTQIMKKDYTRKEPDIYEICRSINKNVAKVGYPQFLLIMKDTVQINPKYLC